MLLHSTNLYTTNRSAITYCDSFMLFPYADMDSLYKCPICDYYDTYIHIFFCGKVYIYVFFTLGSSSLVGDMGYCGT